VRSYQNELAADPERLAVVEERLDLIARLRRKYGATIEDILAYGTQSAEELERLGSREERTAALQQREVELRSEIGALAWRLSQARARAADQLARAMESQLDDLHMKRAGFRVDLTQRPDPDGVTADPAGSGPSATYAFDASGIDRVEFLIAPNQGEPFKPLARIASGGETSRLMLALKTILARADAVPVLIFDEIDTGISGRAGQVVGEKLWRLARTHQVICVTHLPQIAALADHHLSVVKRVEHERTVTAVVPLSDGARVQEIGQMLGGSATRAARENASDLLERGAEWKFGALTPAEA
jgi:DNA repair protein RecN (Recombination protein N)